MTSHFFLLLIKFVGIAVSFNNLLNDEGSLFVVVIATIGEVDEESGTGLTVLLSEGSSQVPIGHLTKYFITSQCAAFANKPKIFIFIDPEVASCAFASPVHLPVSCVCNQNFARIITFVVATR